MTPEPRRMQLDDRALAAERDMNIEWFSLAHRRGMKRKRTPRKKEASGSMKIHEEH